MELEPITEKVSHAEDAKQVKEFVTMQIQVVQIQIDFPNLIIFCIKVCIFYKFNR